MGKTVFILRRGPCVCVYFSCFVIVFSAMGSIAQDSATQLSMGPVIGAIATTFEDSRMNHADCTKVVLAFLTGDSGKLTHKQLETHGCILSPVANNDGHQYRRGWLEIKSPSNFFMEWIKRFCGWIYHFSISLTLAVLQRQKSLPDIGGITYHCSHAAWRPHHEPWAYTSNFVQYISGF